jgi:hypothetical protein
MPGFERNDWNRFLNGGTSHYNFAYRSEIVTPIEPTPTPAPAPTSVPVPIINAPVAKKSNKVVIPTQKGGKRKSKRGRSQKKYRLARRTHRK